MRHFPVFLLLVSVVLLSGNACVERTPAPPATSSTGGASSAPSPAPAADPARTTPCPPVKTDVICTKEYRPVLCDGCRYANPCLAGAAGFKADQCVPDSDEAAKKKCPGPAPGIVCTMEYAPVICDGCRYSNGCTAGAAGFKKEQCAPAPEE